jgi:hypothetical protein
MKTCNRCKIEKPFDEFHKNNASKNDGLYSICKSCKKEYRENNIEKLKEYYQKNKEKTRDRKRLYMKEYNKERRRTNPLFKLRINISCLINDSIKLRKHRKNTKTQFILGCSFEEFKLHLESQFQPWMNWDNYGNPKDGILEFNKSWDIDHIIPCSSAKNEEELLKLNHYTNLRPLCSKINRHIKSGKVDVLY